MGAFFHSIARIHEAQVQHINIALNTQMRVYNRCCIYHNTIPSHAPVEWQPRAVKTKNIGQPNSRVFFFQLSFIGGLENWRIKEYFFCVYLPRAVYTKQTIGTQRNAKEILILTTYSIWRKALKRYYRAKCVWGFFCVSVYIGTGFVQPEWRGGGGTHSQL